MSFLDRLGISSKSKDSGKEIPKDSGKELPRNVRKEIELRADNLKMEVVLDKKTKKDAEKELYGYIQYKIRETNPWINLLRQDNDEKIRRYVANKFDDSEIEKLKSKQLRSELKMRKSQERTAMKQGEKRPEGRFAEIPPKRGGRSVAPASGEEPSAKPTATGKPATAAPPPSPQNVAPASGGGPKAKYLPREFAQEFNKGKFSKPGPRTSEIIAELEEIWEKTME